jgi:hypothetical protein
MFKPDRDRRTYNVRRILIGLDDIVLREEGGAIVTGSLCLHFKPTGTSLTLDPTRSLSIMATARLVNDHCEPSFSARSVTSLATARPRASPVSMSLRK